MEGKGKSSIFNPRHCKRYRMFLRQSLSCCWCSLLACIISLLALPPTVHGQQSASLHIPAYTTNRSLSVRQNICGRAQIHDNEVIGDELDIRYALEGLKLNVAAIRGIYFRYDNNTLDEEYPGLMAVLMDEIAKRGRFTWRDSFAVYDGPTGNRTWTETLLFMINYYDLSVEWWVETLPRLKLGVSFPEGWYDASYILVTATAEGIPKRKVNMWGWLLPFEPDVWVLILFTLLWSGMVYMFLEYLAFPRQYTGRRARQSFGNDIYMALLLFTQHFQFTPKTPASRMLATSMALWALLISSAYTANLASFFVDESNQKEPVTSIEDAIRLGQPICVWDSAASALYVQKTYPAGRYLKLEQEKDLYLYVNDGLCSAAVTSVASFQDYSRTRETNEDCRLRWTGNLIKQSRAGFASKADAGKLCTSLIHDVVNIHILDMEADGALERLWDQHYARTLDHFCDDADTANDQQSQRRSIQEMGGTFVVHFAVSCLAILLAVYTKLWKVYKKRFLTPNVAKSIRQSELTRESVDVLGPLPNQSMNGSAAANIPLTAETLLQDFWAETPSARMRDSSRDSSIYASLLRRDDGGLNNEQLLELLQDELRQQQDQAEQRLEEKIQQQHDQLAAMMEEKLQQQQDQMEQKIQRQQNLLEQRMEATLSTIMDFLKDNQQGGLSRRVVVVPDNRNNRDQSKSAVSNMETTSRLEEKESQSHLDDSQVNESKKVRLRLKAHQIPKLLYPHDEQELRGAIEQHFGTAGIDIPQEANEISVTLRKVV